MSPPLPLTRPEMLARGWDSVDVVFVTGDAYVDHPSFAAALLARVLEADGFRVGFLLNPIGTPPNRGRPSDRRTWRSVFPPGIWT